MASHEIAAALFGFGSRTSAASRLGLPIRPSKQNSQFFLVV